jgi:class 3 adenylate cyclase
MNEIVTVLVGAVAAGLVGALGYAARSILQARKERRAEEVEELHQQIQRLSGEILLLRSGNVGVGLKRDIEAELEVAMHAVGATESSVLVPYPDLTRQSPYLVFLALHGDASPKIRMTKVGSDSAAGRVFRTGQPELLRNPEQRPSSMRIVDDKAEHVTHNMITVPLRHGGIVVGAAQLLNKRGGTSFTEEDLQQVIIALPSISEKAAQFLHNRGNFEMLGFYPDLAPEEGTILWCDLSASSLLFNLLSARDTFDYVNEYLQRQTQVVIEHGGAFQRYDFDGAFYSFNVPVPIKEGDHVASAVAAAVDLQDDFAKLKQSWERNSRQNLDPIFSRVAIACGEVYKREMGHPRHEQLMILGEAIGRAAHLCDAAPRGRHVIVVDEAVKDRVAGEARFKKLPLSLSKGKQDSHAYELLIGQPARAG